MVLWYGLLWFGDNILRYYFIVWLDVKDRLQIRDDHILLWYLNVSNVCVLCNCGVESHDHLFFDYSFNHTI